MDIYLLDTSYETVTIVDVFESLTWVDKYRGAGSFELKIPADSDLAGYFQEGYYLWSTDSDRMMIIETIQIDVSPDDGAHMTISGESLESILRRRIVWVTQEIEGNLQDKLVALLNENAINPTLEARKIPKFSVKTSEDKAVTGCTVELTQVFGENLYDVIDDICRLNRLGWRVLPDIAGAGFVFEIYSGLDHSYDQNDRMWVVFSKEYDNLVNSRFWQSKTDWKNAILVAGNGKDQEQLTISGALGEYSGLDRREIFLQSNVNYDTEIEDKNEADEKMKTEMRSEAELELDDYQETEGMDGEVASMIQFQYGSDYKLGDIVQIENEYGWSMKARVTEYAITWDSSGFNAIPTFTSMADEDADIKTD